MTSRKKDQSAIQLELNSQEDWDDALAKKGLLVVDVYQQWAGPCLAMQSNLKKIKIELRDELLHFAVANADKIDALKKYRGKCEPTWLFFGICDPAMSVETDKEQEQTAKEEEEKEVDEEENEIVEGMNEIRRRSRAKISQFSEEDLQIGMMSQLTLPRPVTVAIIKPDVVGDGMAYDIIREIQNSGFEIVQQENRKLCQEEVEKLYGSCLTTETFEELLTFMTSKECHLLLLAKEENVISEWIGKMGPEKVNLAKETAPDSLRAQYGTDDIRNAVHGSADEHAVLREVSLLFPTFLNQQELAKDSSKEPTQDERQMPSEGITTEPYEGDDQNENTTQKGTDRNNTSVATEKNNGIGEDHPSESKINNKNMHTKNTEHKINTVKKDDNPLLPETGQNETSTDKLLGVIRDQNNTEDKSLAVEKDQLKRDEKQLTGEENQDQIADKSAASQIDQMKTEDCSLSRKENQDQTEDQSLVIQEEENKTED
ncbi:thioredoxin domain-containing protein 6-like isoform X2 [Limulus polyphemus]|uniref:Thioredoxin domain-containing protein 6-like isoform X2 n=1 Tax=Limulus polyphemus TaxID=6850 RepID=A0ABM1S889_LIMPO|nr:thioredoxin domain-containing protein 6-like isoform X2 [Limulus polyphemus]